MMRTIDLSGENVLVTGAAGSIGGAIARDLAGAGAFVVVSDISETAIQRVSDEITQAGGKARPRVMDVRSTQSVDDTVEAIASEGAPLTGLVNAAGILRTGPLESMTDGSWEDMMEVNVTGTFRTTRAAARHFKKARRGSIVNVSSVSAFIGSAEGAAYTSTKGAVLSFTYGTAGELAPYGVRVNAVCPAWVDGGFTHQAMENANEPAALVEQARRLHPLGRMGAPSDVAAAVVWLMSADASFVTGTPLFVDGGFMIHRGLAD